MNQDLISYKYTDAVIPHKFVICGLTMRPFCLGHYMLLEYMQNPMINPEKVDIEMNDGLHWFFMALIICSLTYEDGIKLLSSEEDFKSVSKQFFDNLKKDMDIQGWNIFTKLNTFRDYVRYYLEMPIYTEESQTSEPTTPSGTDWKQNMFLIFKKLGYDESDILNMNLKKLFYEWCSYAEGEGAIKVMNKVDLEQLKQLRKKK